MRFGNLLYFVSLIARVVYTTPNAAKIPYTIPTTPPRPATPHIAISEADQVVVLVVFKVGIKTLANIRTPRVKPTIAPTILAIFYNHPINIIISF
jgi:hypothetical protein